MAEEILGIHHITALASDPQHNLDFYTGALGLRLVKRTVNFDDPTTYHFYYGNESGAPGTILTFFPWPESPRGRLGTGQVTATAFSIPESSLDYWGERLERGGAAVDGLETRFGERVLTFSDPLQCPHPQHFDISPCPGVETCLDRTQMHWHITSVR